MKRVLFLIKGLGRGGAEQLLVAAAPHLDTSRFHYEVAYVLPLKDALAGVLEDAGMEVHSLGGPGLRWLRQLRGLIRQRGIDLVHAHSPYPAACARLALGLSRKPAFVYTEHNEWPRYRASTRWANMVTYPLNDYVFAVSDGVARSVRHPPTLPRFAMPPVETLRHGVDFGALPNAVDGLAVRSDLGIPAWAPVVGTVANFKPHKAHHLLVEAMVIVRQAVPETRFVLVGQGPLLEDTRALVAGLGLDDAVVFTGFRSDAQRLNAAFDIFALSSMNEGLSIALLEAMACGVPPVVTAVGGLPEVVDDGLNGLLVPPGDVSALADGIVRLLEDPDLRTRMGDAARHRAQRFDIRTAVTRVEQVYEELLR